MTDSTRSTSGTRAGASGAGSASSADDGNASPVDRIKGEVDRAKETLEEVKEEVSAAIDAKRGGPATSVTDALAKTSQLRGDIEQDLATLRARIPDPAELRAGTKRAVAVVGGGLLVLGSVAAVVRKRQARKARERETREQAAALARELARELTRLGTDGAGDSEGGSGGRWKWLLLALAGAGAFAAWWQRRNSGLELDDALDLDLEDEGLHGIGPI